MKKALVFCTLIICVLSIIISNEIVRADNNDVVKELEVIKVWKGRSSGLKEGEHVIKNQDDWNKLKPELKFDIGLMPESVPGRKPVPFPKNIQDFEKNMILGVSLENVTLGSGISFEKLVLLKDGTIKVIVKKNILDEAVVPGAMGRPYYFVMIPKVKGKVVFEYTN